MASANDYEGKDFVGVQPAAEDLSKKIREQVNEETVPSYIKFIQEKLVSNSVERAREIAIEAGVVSGLIGEKPFFVSDEDIGINGSIGNSFAMVKPGKKEKPLRIIIAHSDVPSLRVPVNPVFTPKDAREEIRTPTVSLITEPFGGIRPDDWYGMDVEIVGKLYKNGIKTDIFLPGRIKQKSLHVDHPAIQKSFSGLKVDTGYPDVGSLFSALGIRTADDFARAKLYCLPKIKENGSLIGNELGGFGHDDRCCVWASLKAGLETMTDNDNTTLIFALDNEEIGSVGNSASYRGFFENIVRETIGVVYGKSAAREIELPAALNRELLGGMPAIFADVGVGLGPEELEDRYEMVDINQASRMGWGVMINSGVTTSPKHIDRLVTSLLKDLPGRNKRYRYQIGGDYIPIDSRAWSASGQMHDSFGDVLPCLNVGIPVLGLHHPRTETINVFDLHWMKEAYKVYLRN
jgi:aspartyl aminopeptidase